jgi:alpha-2-macroglobulin
MDLIRFCLLLPLRLLRLALIVLAWALSPLIGRFTWTAPRWVGYVKRHPTQTLSTVLTFVAVGGLGFFGWRWYEHRTRPPEPVRITWNVQAPGLTDYTKKPIVVQPLQLTFSASAAPIERVGKSATAGILMQPDAKGQWTWVDDHTLRFTPQDDWPVGQHYQVRFDVKKAFAPHVLMAADRFEFDTTPFMASLGDGEFYQDPQKVTDKQVIVPVEFDYPVDQAAFEKRMALALLDKEGNKGPPIAFTITYDQYRLHAWIHSQPLELPRDDGAVELTLDRGVCAVRGGPCTTDRVTTRVRVPGLYSLSIDSFEPTLVDNDRYEPEQVLVVTVSGAVRDHDLDGLIHAWLLPEQRPGTPPPPPGVPIGERPFPWTVGLVGDAELRASQALTLTLVPTANDYQEVQSFKYHAPPHRRVYVRIEKGLKSFGGYILGQPESTVFTVPDYPQLLRFVASGSLLPLGGSERISVVSRNEPGLRVEVSRVLPDQLQHLASLNQSDYGHPRLPYDFGEEHIVDRQVITRAIAASDPGEAHYEGIDLSPYLQAGRRGVFLLHLYEYDPERAERRAAAAARLRALAQQGSAPAPGAAAAGAGTPAVGTSPPPAPNPADYADDGRPPTDSRLIVVTDLGMIVKRALDGAQDVFVQSIRTGRPVAEANVSVVATNGETLYAETTDADGSAHFPAFDGLRREKLPVMYVVKKGEDSSFLPIRAFDRQLDFSRFDIGGKSATVNAGQLSGYLFSDRGIYRPGDTFHIGLIVRAASWVRSVAGIPLQAEVVDPRGMTVKTFPVTMDPSGFGELSYATDETSPTGAWSVNLRIVRDGKASTQIGSTTVQVKEFLPDRLKVSAHFSREVPEGWVKPDGLRGLVDAQNLFGTPAADRRVEATLTLRPAWPAFHDWAEYHFYDIRRAKEGYDQTLQDGITDAKGHAEFDLDLKKYVDATYQMYLLVRVHDAGGGRSVAAAAETLVSANDWLVGYKSSDDLDYISRGAKRGVRLVAIDAHAKSITLEGLTAQLVERRYLSVLTKQPSGVYKYESTLKEVPVSEAPLAIPAGGLEYTLPTDRPGDFALRILRPGDRNEVNRVSYTVAGTANLARSLERTAELQLSLDKQDYQPGETIAVSIRAPYTGSGLVTIERDKVYAHTWFHAATTSSVQHITVPRDFEGNGYVNVQFVRDPSSDEIFMSPLSYGVAPFSVSLGARRAAISVDAPALVKPGQTLALHVRSERPTRAVVFAVDEGILQVARYQLDDPLKFFFRKKMLQVETAQILDLILPEFAKLMSMSAAPGGGEGAVIGRQLNPFKRKHEKPVAYWSGIIDVDGTKDLSYTVPDYFNGKLRVMAIAVSPERMGTYQGDTTVRGDFVLSPNVPATLAPGDESEVTIGVANNLTGLGGRSVPVVVSLATTSGVKVVGSSTQRLSLAEMHEGVAHFHVTATEALGSATLTFTARYGAGSASQNDYVSVRPAAAYRTQVDVGRIESGQTAELAPLRQLFPAYASRDAAISNIPIVLAQPLVGYLVNGENYCSEQVISMAMPRIVVAKWPLVPVFAHALQPALGDKSVSNDQAIAHLLDVLQSRQNSAGGFGLWSATPDSEPFVSAYAMNLLLEARDRGIAVPPDMIEAGDRYLQTLADDDSMDSLDQLRQRAYAVYLLTRQGNVTTNALAGVEKQLRDGFPKDWQDDLAAAWLAAAYELMRQDDEANTLIGGPARELARQQAEENFIHGYYYDPLTRDATVLYLLAKHFPERSRKLPPRVFENIAWPLAHGEFNTTSAAMTILALDSYASETGRDLGKLRIDQISSDGRAISLGTLEGNLIQADSWDPSAAKLRFINHSALPAWYVASQGGYDRGPVREAVKNGLEIVRDYTDTDGRSLGSIPVGDEIDVHVRIRAIGESAVGNVAIVDLLPGGFEPVIEPPPPLNGQGGDAAAGTQAWSSPIGLSSSSWRPEYADIREDRVVIYGTATPDVREFVYRIKATNAGKFSIPPAYAESMYDRTLQARAPGAGELTVTQ